MRDPIPTMFESSWDVARHQTGINQINNTWPKGFNNVLEEMGSQERAEN